MPAAGAGFKAKCRRRPRLARRGYNFELPNVTEPTLSTARPKPLLLLILDGWGHRDDPADNALAQARLPNWCRLLADFPHTLVHTEGRHVGLPDGQMGNSEVGHMNIGAGRIVYQDLTRVDAAIEDGSFFANEELLASCRAVNASGGTLHLFDLLSPGGVHSHESHLFAMIDLARREGVGDIAVHAFLDGRDTPPRSAEASLEKLAAVCGNRGDARIATISGRYWAMDRDNRWDRVERAYRAIAEADADDTASDVITALHSAYGRGENDEFVQPTVINGARRMRDGDAVVFMNFRADRARQLTSVFASPDFAGFVKPRGFTLSRFTCLTEYDARLPAPVAFGPEDLRNTLGDVLAANGLTQLRIAETEKYAHVTFFMSGGREAQLAGEDRALIPSPKVATYDLQPEMNLPQLTARLTDDIRARAHDVIICNVANPDMVGHSGILAAAVQAAEAVDDALGAIRAALESVGGEMIVTADHGNLEMMRDPETGQPHTSHTVGPVPLVYVGRKATLRGGGALRDIAPTMLQLLGLPQPPEMTGRTLVTLA